MTPAARVQAAIEVLDAWLAGGEGLDRQLVAWGRASRFAGSGDRRAVADLAYDAVRRKRSALWMAGAEVSDGRSLLIGTLLLDGHQPVEFFTGGRYGPAPLSEAEAERLRKDLDGAPWGVRFDLPDWMEPELIGVPEAALAALRARAPLDLRVNRLKTHFSAAQAALARDAIQTVPGPLGPECLRITEGAQRLRTAGAYRTGLVEIQDAASQAVAHFAGALPGEVVLDLCAGGGGKTLAMATDMAGEGRLMAYDIAPSRMGPLEERADRAGARVEVLDRTDLSQIGPICDLVLVDAPCSGSGAWRRNPDARWDLTPERLAELREVQRNLLRQAAELTAPGGRIVYATCSLLARENAAVVADAPAGWAVNDTLSLTPLDGGDGFFAARLQKVVGDSN